MNTAKLVITSFLLYVFSISATEKLVYVDAIKDLLREDLVVEALELLPPEELAELIDELNLVDGDTVAEVRKKLKDKLYCYLAVKQKVLTNNLRVCRDTTLNNLTVNGIFDLNSANCLDVNCIVTNTITANFITTKTLVAQDIIGTFSVAIENAVFTEFFTGPLLGDVTGTQNATHVAFVCGVPACALAQTYSTVLSATSSNICGTLVLRDSNCNFSANLITATATNALVTQTALFITSVLTSVSAQFANSANFALTSSFALSAQTSTSATYFTGNLFGDVVGTQTATRIVSVCGIPACALVQTYSTLLSATSSNICGTLVLRDSNCNFSANLITATATNALVTQTALFAYSALTSVSAQFANFALTSSSAVSALSSTSAIYFTGNLYGDVIGTQTATQVAFVCGVPACALAQTFSTVLSATSSNICGTLVLRDSNCNFSANLITATATNALLSQTVVFANSSLTSVSAQFANFALTSSFAVSALTSTSAIYFTGNLYGDVVGTQTATQVAFVCGIPACTLAQTFSSVLSATSADIPLTLVLRDSTGSFASTTITLTGCLLLYDSTNSLAGTVCANTNALIVAPQTTRALQTTANGSTRGTNAIDLQMVQNSTQVASGNYSGILSGSGNTASGAFAVVSGGVGNMASAAGSVVAGGGTDGTIFAGNTASGLASVVGGGIGNTASGNYSGVLTGSGNSATNLLATIGGGFGNTIVSNAGIREASVILAGGYDGTNFSGNSIGRTASFNGGGIGNIIMCSMSAIVSGSGNATTTSGFFNFIGSGQANSFTNEESVIMGGLKNTGGFFSSNLGGSNNAALGTGSVIMGGGTDGILVAGNSLSGIAAFIGAGLSNSDVSSPYSAIVSGSGNGLPGFEAFSFVGGGQANALTSQGNEIVAMGGANNNPRGNVSAILSGSGNKTGQIGAVAVGGGFDGTLFGGNNSSFLACFVGGGLGNVASNTYSSVVSGSGNTASGVFTFIGGGQANSSVGAIAIMGGSKNSGSVLCGSGNTANSTTSIVMGGGFDGILQGGNHANQNASFVGSGLNNILVATSSSVVTGSGNSIVSSANNGFIGGGQLNALNGVPPMAAVFGGLRNIADAASSAVLSGSGNTVGNAQTSVIVAGGFDGSKTQGNTITGGSAFIGNGLGNSTSGSYSAILSGTTNIITFGTSAAILGGNTNSTSGANSFLAGSNIANSRTGSFIWSDTSLPLTNGNANNTFNVRASGGTYIVTTTLPSFIAGVKVAPGGATWLSLSDMSFKRNLHEANINLTLDQLSTLTIYNWGFIGQDPSIVHIGPLAQDFHTIFTYDENPLYINDSDALGILIASVQALYQQYIVPLGLKQKFLEQEQRISQLGKRLRRLEDIQNL